MHMSYFFTTFAPANYQLPITNYQLLISTAMPRTILYLFLLISIPVFSEEIYSRRINSDIGLPDNNVRNIAIDQQGFLWLGTPNGLYRYDGYFFTQFRHDNDRNALLFSNHINALASLQSGLLLVRQQGDLYSLYDIDKGQWIDMTVLGKRPQFHYYAEVDSTLWLWEEGGAAVAYQYSDGQLSYTFFHSNEVPHPERETKGYHAALRLLGHDGWNNIIFDNLSNPCVIDLTGRLIWFDRESAQQVPLQIYDPHLVPLIDSRKYTVHTSPDGHYTWITTNGYGITLYNHWTKQSRHISSLSEVIETDFIISATMDSEGNLFVCDDAHGVEVIASPHSEIEHLIPFPNARLFRQNRIATLCPFGDGVLISNTLGNTLRLDTATLQMAPFAPLDGKDVHTALRTHSGYQWVGTRQRGLHNLSNTRYVHDPKDPSSIASNNIIDLYEDTDGRLWIANYFASLDLLTDSGFLHFFPESKGFRVVTQDHLGRLWAGGKGELYTFFPDQLLADSSAFSLALSEEQIKFSDISDLCEDAFGQMWVSTLGDGVYCMQADTIISHIDASSGLISDYVHSLIFDLTGTLWMATQRGITCYSPSNGKITHIYDDYNLLRNTYSDHAAFRLPDGRLLFGTDDGISVFYPGKTTATQLLRPHLTEILVNNTPLSQLQPETGVAYNADHIQLSYNENTITFRFSSFNYHSAAGSLYSYRLEGFDKEWSDVQPFSFAQYRNLRPGRYIFRVRAYNSNNTGEECSLILDIRRPWWSTWWAILLYILSAAGIIWLIYIQLKRYEALRNRLTVEQQLTEYKMLFFTNVSHEFRTPLTIIRSAIDRIASLENIPSSMRQPIASMQHSTERMMRLINQLMSFRMAQLGSLQLHLQDTEVVDFLREIYSNFTLWAERKNVQLEFKMTHHSYTMPADRWILELVAYNLISNALKYTPQGGHIVVRVAIDDSSEHLIFSVSDDGIGITPERRAQVFDSYMHTSFSSGNASGIGLHFTRSLVEIHHGTITYTPSQPNGSTFTVTLPTQPAAYDAKDFMTDEQKAKSEAISMPALTKTQPADVEETAKNPLNDRYVLIVDDDEQLRAYMQSLLSRYFHVDAAEDGVDAWHRIEERKPDLVISDVMMSVLDGYELVSRIRSTEATRSIPVILLSALTSDEKRVRAMKLGADAYLTKPFDTNVLITTCQSLLFRHDQLKQSFAGEVVEKKEALPQIVVEERDRQFLRDLEHLTETHLTDPQLSVDYLGATLGMGRTLFFKRVKALTGLTPADYIRSVRMKKAAQLLANDRLSVSEVSYAVGIEDPHYFIKLFKQMYGITPKKYQKGQKD